VLQIKPPVALTELKAILIIQVCGTHEKERERLELHLEAPVHSLAPISSAEHMCI
jgi:hypothetical protein